MNDENHIREINALIRLIDEPDRSIYLEISKRIHAIGAMIIPFLENEWENSSNPLIQERIEDLIHQIRFENLTSELDEWIRGGSRNLLQACLIIARYHYPELEDSEIENAMSKIRKDIWLELNDNLTALEKIRVFNHVLFNIHHFKGNTSNYHEPVNSFLNMVLERKKGNPLSLGIVYLLIAQSLDLPVFGVNLPEHFILVYTETEFLPEVSEIPGIKPLFFINAFNRGVVYSKEEVVSFLKHLGYEPKPAYFNPCSNDDIIKRMLYNLANSFAKAGQSERVADMEALIRLFDTNG